ncbi:MAG TPA: sulfatase, partial [Erysipelotrichaceae bacterium]|nr:sulfatase [Erysipelotrichaceae bacterium]
MTKKPNIIIINPDEMRWNTMGHMGNPAASTPRLDAFAETEAVSFENAYCQNPVCVPSRCSFLTGLYPHVNGHRTMHYLMHDGRDTLFAELRNAGYRVWMNARNDFIAGNEPGLMATQFDEI